MKVFLTNLYYWIRMNCYNRKTKGIAWFKFFFFFFSPICFISGFYLAYTNGILSYYINYFIKFFN